MGKTTSQIMRKRRRDKMSDAGIGDGDEGLEGLEALGVFDDEGEMGQESEGISALVNLGESIGESRVSGTDLTSPDITEGLGGPSIKPEKKEEEKPEELVKEKKPVITRAKRRRSLLSEEEGGVLRRPTVYRRSILGR